MWSIEALEDIREECMKDAVKLYPEIADQLKKQRIEVNHKRVRTMARYSSDQIQISAYLLSDKTPKKFFQTIIMRAIIRTQIKLLIPDSLEEMIEFNFISNFDDKYDFDNMLTLLHESECEIPEKKIERNDVYRYAVKCPRCGQIFRYKRMCKTVSNPSDYICTKCHVPLERLF